MRAIRVHDFGEPEVMRLEEVPDLSCGPGQVLVEVRAAGVNPVDTYIRAGRYSFGEVPYTPGMDAAGVVRAVGKGVTSVSLGNRVYTAGTLSGAYAEKALCKEQHVHHLPLQVSFSQGAALGVPYATAYRALFQRAHAKEGEVVLVHGASGGVGIDRGRELVAEQGAHHVLNHHEPDHFERALQLTDGRGIDVILEMLANVNLGEDLEVMAMGARVVVIGSRGKVEIDPRLAMSRDVSILGMILMNASEPEICDIHSALGAGLENGSLRPVVGLELPLEEAARAHHEITESSHYGKIVLIP
ncbi:MAG: NADPH:quinone reductase [Planctomycetota bacterium]|jgi:NADPH2:quinone reductase